MSGAYYLESSGSTAAYAIRLRGDIVSLQLMLDNYTRPAEVADPVEELVIRAMRQLDAISDRFEALGESPNPAELRISDQEAAALDAARELRGRMMESLTLLQQDERARFRPKS